MSAKTWKEWEKPLIELEDSIARLKELVGREADPGKKEQFQSQLSTFADRRDRYIKSRYDSLDAWEKVLVARADPRPYTLDYVSTLFHDFTELDGDRRYGADHAIVAGPARFNGTPVMVVGHQKGRNIQERAFRNFAMAKPEGYRKAIRMFEMAERFRMPVVTFVDTPAADPGVESESRGISEAIAASMLAMFELTVPVVSIVVGEGGSGGAIGIAAANTVLMQEHAVYSVIPPEGCAAILWRKPEKGAEASSALKLTAASALEFNLIDGIVPEPFGGAHRDPAEAARIVGEVIEKALADLTSQDGAALKAHRYSKFRQMGKFEELAIERS